MPGNSPPPAPTLVASNMSSDTNVGQLQTLLGIRGGGSDLLFGNLITVPIQNSLLYVRPVYVKASGANNPPLLRKVVVQFNNAVKVADTLPEALKLFPEVADLPTGAPRPRPPMDHRLEPLRRRRPHKSCSLRRCRTTRTPTTRSSRATWPRIS